VVVDEVTLPPGDAAAAAVAGDMVVLPGTVDSVAVALRNGSSSVQFDGLVVLDDGVPRDERVDATAGAAALGGGPSGWIYGFNDETSAFGLAAIEVTDAGPVLRGTLDVGGDFDVRLAYAEERILLSAGPVLDVSTPGAPRKVGTLPNPAGAITAIAGDSISLSAGPSSFDPVVLRRCDPSTFIELESLPVDAHADARGVGDVASYDGRAVAFIATDLADLPNLFVVPDAF
jgi:hypothetical protein